MREFLKTEVGPQKIARCLSLCGPSVERLEKAGKDFVYSIEVTTNRVDSAGVCGIAREAAAILPRFGVKAYLQPIKAQSTQRIAHRVSWIDVVVDQELCPRFTAILIKNVQLKKSPVWMEQRLKLIGLRPINNIVDISNYLMHELGQPMHTFDYDKIKGARMTLRPSKPGEKITTLDDKEYTLPGGDIIIEDGEGRLIDLAGIMGGSLSAVDRRTKNVLLFVQTYNPVRIRRTSMNLAKRSEASSLFEKGLDPELVEIAIRRGIDLFVELCEGEPENEILNIYQNPYGGKIINVGAEFINERLGVKLSEKEIIDILGSLEFKVAQRKDGTLAASVPSFRAQDINIPEDIVEEVARLYGYHRLPSLLMHSPSLLMPGTLPEPPDNQPFRFEGMIKQTLKGWGAIELYTLALVSKEKVTLSGGASWALRLKNPLGTDSEYLRQSLAPSLVDAAEQNPGEKSAFHLFEMANVYLPVRGRLPEESMMLAGIFANYGFRQAKGTIEALLDELHIDASWAPEDARGFRPNQRISIKLGREDIGQFGVLEKNLIYYEFDLKLLQAAAGKGLAYTPIPKYPAQIEDLALVFPSRTRTADVIKEIKKSDKQIVSAELIDIYNDTRTFRLAYQNTNKTLTDKEVEKIRNRLLLVVKKKFGVTPKP